MNTACEREKYYRMSRHLKSGYDRLLFVTDAAMNIAPDLEAKAQIIRNAVATAHACGVT